MDERQKERKEHPTVLIVERRKQGKRELTSAEVMRVVRNRSITKSKDEGAGAIEEEET